ncbi:unnamed protein product [Cuscuta campestris]|uniref:DET1- and DDB1-associated protein 1 domain-containing protein n=1 Tax=Cuscuta campestris TaxID=132261 RepID=A0A484M2L3_9ASTE|nr:unnamed protein product [Cuscuta campestris]
MTLVSKLSFSFPSSSTNLQSVSGAAPPTVAPSMGSMFGDWPSFDPHNFTQLRPSDPSAPSRITPATYCPTHDRTLPSPDQVICSEPKNIFIRHLYQHGAEKMRPKRAASENLAPEHGSKVPKSSHSDISF